MLCDYCVACVYSCKTNGSTVTTLLAPRIVMFFYSKKCKRQLRPSTGMRPVHSFNSSCPNLTLSFHSFDFDISYRMWEIFHAEFVLWKHDWGIFTHFEHNKILDQSNRCGVFACRNITKKITLVVHRTNWREWKIEIIVMMKRFRPGPAKYTLPTTVGFNGHDIRKNRLPAHSFGLRLPNDDHVESPAPNTYALPSTIGGQDKVTTFFRLIILNICQLILKCQPIFRPLKEHQLIRSLSYWQQKTISYHQAQMLTDYKISIQVGVHRPTQLVVDLEISSKPKSDNWTYAAKNHENFTLNQQANFIKF